MGFLEIIAEAVFEFVLLWVVRYPGALIRWAIFRRRKYKEYLEDDLYANAFPLILIAIIIVLIKTAGA